MPLRLSWYYYANESHIKTLECMHSLHDATETNLIVYAEVTWCHWESVKLSWECMQGFDDATDSQWVYPESICRGSMMPLRVSETILRVNAEVLGCHWESVKLSWECMQGLYDATESQWDYPESVRRGSMMPLRVSETILRVYAGVLWCHWESVILSW